jgi:nucleotide-binding universal stress UspA family protein
MTENPTATSRIVVGVDGSEPSKSALRWATSLAQQLGCTVQAVGAWQLPLGAGMSAAVPDWDPESATRTVVRDTVRDVLGEHPPVAVEIAIREGNAAHVLIAAAERARILVVGSRGRGGFAGLLLGSVSTACAAHSQCPVLVVHGDTPPPMTE